MGNFKVTGCQEWITAIECISAAGKALLPLIIFKAAHSNTAWVPTHTPLNWRFTTSHSGWTSDSHGYEWLTKVFQLETAGQGRRLLIMDGHSSHCTANVIAFCMENKIDLAILPPHTSHLPQPLDVAVFGPIKRALADETDQHARVNTGRISKVEWTTMFIKARQQAVRKKTILAGFRGAGLWPLSPISILSKLKAPPAQAQEPQKTGLDMTLLGSNPPDGTELCEANQVLLDLIVDVDMPSPAKRYLKRLAGAAEIQSSEIATLRAKNS